ncbi:MAG: MOSC domain-containing protein [Rhodospirillaceae bacterium]|nr:MOSC domain-containing protein [Rhodospirillaceae bacterium]
MIPADHLSCLAGEGIEGDRYALGTGTFSKKPEPGRQLTIIENEALEALKHFPDISCLAEQCRRNVISQGIRLNSLVGKIISIGNVELKVHRLCQPCGYLEGKLKQAGLKDALWDKGGVRCEILNDGTITVENTISLVD